MGLQDIGAEYWQTLGARERKQRLIKVDGFDVLRENNYEMNQVGSSVCARLMLICLL